MLYGDLLLNVEALDAVTMMMVWRAMMMMMMVHALQYAILICFSAEKC